MCITLRFTLVNAAGCISSPHRTFAALTTSLWIWSIIAFPLTLYLRNLELWKKFAQWEHGNKKPRKVLDTSFVLGWLNIDMWLKPASLQLLKRAAITRSTNLTSFIVYIQFRRFPLPTAQNCESDASSVNFWLHVTFVQTKVAFKNIKTSRHMWPWYDCKRKIRFLLKVG